MDTVIQITLQWKINEEFGEQTFDEETTDDAIEMIEQLRSKIDELEEKQ